MRIVSFIRRFRVELEVPVLVGTSVGGRSHGVRVKYLRSTGRPRRCVSVTSTLGIHTCRTASAEASLSPMQDANPVGDAKAEASNDTAKPMIRTPSVEVSKDTRFVI